MAIYDTGLSPSYQEHTFSKMEHFKGISVKKPSFAYRYSNSEQHGRTLGFAELRDARFI
jgi:hypothetical protein